MRCRLLSAQELSAEIAALQQEQERLRSALEARGAEKRGLAAELRRLKASIVEEKKAQMASKFKRATERCARLASATWRRLSLPSGPLGCARPESQNQRLPADSCLQPWAGRRVSVRRRRAPSVSRRV